MNKLISVVKKTVKVPPQLLAYQTPAIRDISQFYYPVEEIEVKGRNSHFPKKVFT